MKFVDRNGNEITAGMYLRFADGSIEKVYVCSDGYDGETLGINASNEAYMQANGLDEYYREFYPLSNFNMNEVEICEPELQQTDDLCMSSL